MNKAMAMATAVVCVLACGGGGPSTKGEEAAAPATTPEAPNRTLDALLLLDEPARAARIHGDKAVGTATYLENEAGDVSTPALFPDTADEVLFSWDGSRIRGVWVRHPQSTWSTTAGVRIGSSLADLERLNGAPLSLRQSPRGIEIRDVQSPLAQHTMVVGGPKERELVWSQEELSSDAANVRDAQLVVTELHLNSL